SVSRGFGGGKRNRNAGEALLSGGFGALIGCALGIMRTLIVIALLFIYVNVAPGSGLAGYVQASSLYQQGVDKVIEPYTGTFLHRQLPIFTEAVEQQFEQILQRKYEVIDRNIPDEI